mgnify:FL=1
MVYWEDMFPVLKGIYMNWFKFWYEVQHLASRAILWRLFVFSSKMRSPHLFERDWDSMGVVGWVELDNKGASHIILSLNFCKIHDILNHELYKHLILIRLLFVIYSQFPLYYDQEICACNEGTCDKVSCAPWFCLNNFGLPQQIYCIFSNNK